MHLVAVRQAIVGDGRFLQVDRVDDQRVAFPVARCEKPVLVIGAPSAPGAGRP